MYYIFDDYDVNCKNYFWSGSLLLFFIVSYCIYLLFFCKKGWYCVFMYVNLKV